MDLQRSLLLNLTYFHQDKSMDEVRQSLVLSMELEARRIKAEEDLKMRDKEIAQLKDLLSAAIKERDEAQNKCQKVLFEKLLLQQHLHQSTPHSGISSIESDDPRRGIDSTNGFASSDCDESIVSSPHQLPPPAAAEAEPEFPIVVERALPEKGKFLEAVMKAGPLLQTLLLAGPLPQWRHPPPPLDTYQIPPPPTLSTHSSINQESFNNVNNCGTMNRKRGLSENYDHSSMEFFKYQRIVLQ